MYVVNDLSKDVTLFNKSNVNFKPGQPLLELLKSLSIPFHFDFELFLLALQGLLSLKNWILKKLLINLNHWKSAI